MNDLVPLMSRRMLALIMIVLTVLVAGVGAQAQTTTDIKINFMPTDTPPTGYEADTGASYGLRDNGLTYGWLSVNTNQPFDASVNARDRDTGAPTLDDTLMHLRYNECCPDGGNGTQEPVYWEIAVPNGTYSVVVSVGDENNESTIETSHQIAAEGVVIADGSGGLSPFEYPAQNVNVSDGRLTIDQALSGFNTKINYIEITATSVTPVDTPSIADVRPANGATNVFRDTSIATDLALVNGNGGVQASTLTDANVYLREQGSSTNIPAGLNTTGGFDAIVLVPSVPLEANTTYEFTVTQNVTDQAGVPFELFTSTFTTGTEFERQYDGSIEFEQVSAGASPGNYSSLEVGPDGKLYGSTINGNLLRWDINPDGTLSNQETIISLSGRAVVGMTHDPNSTAANPIVWISHATFGFSNMPDWGSKISKVTNINTNPTVQDVVVDLPRSAKDHLSNSLTFKDGMLYLIQGSNSAMGAPDGAWSNRPERALNAAVIQIDVNAISGTLNVKTEDGGTYDPFAENAPVTVWASGIRNAYDLVWHSNGSLYVPTNGSASGGNSPGTPNPLPDICNERIDGLPYTGGSVPAANSIETQNDYLFRAEQGGYYGHPNPTRCEWVLNGGNPTSSTDPAQVNKYPVGVQPDPNYRGFAFDFGKSQSPNGVIEYQNNAFGGALQGQLIVTRYSSGNDLIVLEPNNLDGTGNGDIQNAVTGIDGFTGLSNPLDLTEDVTTGNIYVSEYGSNQLTLLRPLDSSSAPDIRVSAEQLIFEDQLAGSSSYTPAVNPRTVTVSNFGTSPLTLETLSITDTGATRYALPSGLSLPAVVNPGDTLDIDVTFTAQTKGVEVASLNIGSDDPDTPLASVELRGLGKQGLGGSNEPSLQHVLDAFDIDVDTGDNDPATNVISSDTSSSNMNSLLGDEVPVQLFEKAGTGSVTVEPLAVYGPTSADPVTIVGWYSAETDAETTLFSVDNTPSTNGQRLLPDVNGTTSFNPGSDAFGFYSQWPFFSNRKLYSEDAKNTFSGNIPHHVRVYELPGEANAYIVATEEHTVGLTTRTWSLSCVT